MLKRQRTDVGGQVSDRSGAAVRFPPPVAGIMAIVAGYGLGRIVPIFSEYALPTPMRYWIGGIIVAASIGILGFWPIKLFKKTGQDVTPWSNTPEIVVAGPYRFTRNPMYLMMLFVCLGFAVIFSEAWILIFTPMLALVLYHIAIKHEEKYLAGKFGESYAQYKNLVRRWI